MSGDNMKASPRAIIRAHRRSLIDVRSGNRRWQDRVLIEVLPIFPGAWCFLADVKLPATASVGLLTVSGLLSAFLFGVMLQVSDRAMSWADSSPEPSPETSSHATYLYELAANSGYAALVCIVTSAAFVVASAGTGWVLRISTAIGLALATHMALVLFIVMKRIFALTSASLNRARTGADRRDTPRRHAS